VSRRALTALEMGLREYGRTPILLALLLFLPAYMVGLFSWIVPDSPVRVEIGVAQVATEFPELYAVAMVPVVGALVGGIAGLFAMQSARTADARLVLTGFDPVEIMVARFGLLVAAAGVITPIALAVMARVLDPEQLGWLVIATLLVTTTYGAVGLLVGIVANRLVGVYVILLGATLDVFLYQNPAATEQSWVAAWLPAHYGTRLALDAAFTPVVDRSVFAHALCYLLVVGTIAALVFRHEVREPE